MNRRTSRRTADPKVGLYRLLAVAVMSATLSGQQAGLDPATILKPLSDGWPSYSGDYTGRRYSALRQINTSNVKNLTLAWTVRLNAGPNDRGRDGWRR